ncbi:MAG TPA: bacteriohopanetetrol glucosamine biosynthesis glycosyltransferase HpnI [Caulobacteraceae bacterium]|nr:bacteriohopanetetrol glucosamine biosynthesis glycosyltransferase HpnI [Caulobacteraceae bacterium]
MNAFIPYVHGLGWVAIALSQLGALYSLLAAALTLGVLNRAKQANDAVPDVTIVKPLKGADTGLRDALERFCRQDYPGRLQIVFGVQDGADPAIAIVHALQKDYPGLDIGLVVDSRLHGANRKASNLINIVGKARHEVLILSDADILVDPTYVQTVVAALSEPGVGLVSCLYVGQSAGGLWSRLSAMAINYQFIPGAILGKTLGLAQPCFGSTIAMRSEVLASIGGLAAFADHLADDYEIGRAVRRLGLRIAMPPMLVSHQCNETRAGEFLRREVRWGRTVRQIDPLGYAGSVITYPLPLALLGALLLGPSPAMLALVGMVLTMRIAFKLCIDVATDTRAGAWWLLPVSDLLSFGVFVASFAVNRVGWRGARFRVSREGALIHS